jgi:nucleoside-diphosphate-sugar epimerase
MRIFIAGCGYVGTRLGTELAAAGHKVWGLRRRVDTLPAGIEGVAADLTEPTTLTQLPPGLDHVVYATSADGPGETAYRGAYLEGLVNLLDALEAQEIRPRRFFFVSSTGVYGQQDGEWVDETSPTEPSRASGKILLAAERRALAGPFPATVVRLGGIYGPGRTRLLRLVESGEATVSEDPPTYTNRIHRDDAAGLLAHLIHLDTNALPAGQGIPPTQIYLGVDRDPAPRHEVLDWIAERLGVAHPRRVDGETGGRRGGNKRCSSDRLQASGYRFRYPSFRDGYEEMIAGL